MNSLINIFGGLWKGNRNLRGLNYHHIGSQYRISKNILRKWPNKTLFRTMGSKTEETSKSLTIHPSEAYGHLGGVKTGEDSFELCVFLNTISILLE